ncbi:putative deoxyribonuclease TATDN2 [Spea bombifrons]|uniref:putative deoxyribonuclease TATDN2 n=1 Tax=Spea bombifrons TaxID=233779 RepID=UPI00234AF46D|nr:putative deoxyribonuclease TATDN2 [Spea bombifrons]
MAARGSGSQKHKWSSPGEMSPNKFLKGNETKLPRRIGETAAQESECSNLNLNRHVTLYPDETPTKERRYTRTSNIGDDGYDCVPTKGRRHRSESSCSSDLFTRQSESSRRKSTHVPEQCDEYRPRVPKDARSDRKPRAHDPSMLFKRAFHDIIGNPIRTKLTPSKDPESSSEVEHDQESDIYSLDEPAAVPGVTEHNNTERYKQVLESSVENNNTEGFPDRSHAASDTQDEAHTLREDRRLVFIYEDESETDLDKGDVLEKDPSIGSDFSDVEDVSSLIKFSQEDEALSCCITPEDSCGTSCGYVMYPPHLYKSPWRNYTGQWLSNSEYSSCTQQNLWQQEETSHISEHSVNWAENAFPSGSSDSEGAVERCFERSNSFDSSEIYNNTIRIEGRKSDTSAFSGSSPTPKFLEDGFIDTHCHLDMLFSKMAFRGSFAEFRRNHSISFPKEFQGCIADFCNPDTLGDLQWQQLLGEDMVWGAFGCHPHFAQYFTCQKQEEILKALRHPKAIAYGEMGLDYSHKCSTKIPVQHKVFEDQLKLAVSLGKPLVIHCRGADEDLMSIMKRQVPSDYKIHRHCFTGNYRDIEPFLTEFPNMAVGFTALLTYPSAREAQTAMALIPLERLIVETDAPFFLPKQAPRNLCKFAHPGHALYTVQEIARLRSIPVKTVLATLRKNTNQLYNL